MESLDIQKLVLLLGFSLFFIMLGMFIFEKRDLRFGGSGGFRIVIQKRSNPD